MNEPPYPPGTPPPAPDAPPAGERRPLTIAELLERVTPHAWVTPALVGLILAGFGLELALGASATDPTSASLLKAGADFGPYFIAGDYWRPLASMFLHGGLLHLGFNLWAFWQGGRFTERVFGNLPFLALYMLSGLGGALTSLAWHPLTVAVGASGAIFGVYGALLAFVLTHRGVLPREFLIRQRNSLFAFIGYNLVFGFSQPNIDMAAHAGGFVTGGLCGVLLARDLLDPRAHAVRRAVSTAIMFGGLVLCAIGVKNRIAAVPEIRADRAADEAMAALKAGNFPRAIERYDEAIAAQPEAGWLINRGLAHMWKDELEKARSDFAQSNALAPSAHAEALLCEVGVKIETDPKKVEDAVHHCDVSIGMDPKRADALRSRALGRLIEDRFDEAGEDAKAALAIDPSDDVARRIHAEVGLQGGKASEVEEDCKFLLADKGAHGLDYRICARAAILQKDLGVARERLDKALELEPDQHEALGLRASIADHEGRLADAIADYASLTRAEPDDSTPWNNKAWLEVETGDFATAKKDADRAVALDPASGYALGTRCFARVGLGEVEEARVDCAKAVELNDEPADRGMLAFLEKRYGAARKEWEAASQEGASRARELKPWIARLPR